MGYRHGPKIRRIAIPVRFQSRLTEADQGISPLERSLEDAELLVTYAAEQAVKVEKGTLDAIAQARELLEQKALSGTHKADFYNNFIALSRAVAPVTATSLKSCVLEKEYPHWLLRFEEGMLPKWLSTWLRRRTKETEANRALRFYHNLGYVLLFSLIVVQGYWSIGNYLMGNVPILNENNTEREEAIRQEARYYAPRANRLPPPDTAVTPAASQKSSDDAAVARDQKQNSTIDDQEVQKYIDDIKKTQSLTNEALLVFWAPLIEQIKHAVGQENNRYWITDIIARVNLNFLHTYVLPLLYGAIGAIAYVVRRLIGEINSFTYRHAAKSPYNTRILLGGLAGLAIGWFYQPSTNKTLCKPFRH